MINLLVDEAYAFDYLSIFEIKFDKGYIDETQLLALAKAFHQNQYGQYLLRRLER